MARSGPDYTLCTHRLDERGKHRTVIRLKSSVPRPGNHGNNAPRVEPTTDCYPLRRVQTSFTSFFKRSGCPESRRQKDIPERKATSQVDLAAPPRNSQQFMSSLYRSPFMQHTSKPRDIGNRQSFPSSPSKSNSPTRNHREASYVYHQPPSYGDVTDARLSQSLPSLPTPSILKRPTTTAASKGSARKACFRQEVDVRYYDVQDRPQTTRTSPGYGAYVVDGKDSPDQLPRITSVLSPTGASSSRVQISGNSPVRSSASSDNVFTSVIAQDGRDAHPGVAARGLAYNTDVSLVHCVDGRGKKGRLLRLNMTANAPCIRERTLVKALSGGGAVIVHLYENEAQDGGSAVLRHHVKKLALPCNVDPYRVRAHVHKNGVLTIEAPVQDAYTTKT